MNSVFPSPVFRRQQGFTLIELSIALVIIGLIVGGILVGQDMIFASQMRSVVSDVEKLTAAVNTFRARYNCLPGDCANASSFFSTATNGNGDGHIDSTWWGNSVAFNGSVSTNSSTGESFQFWYHLQQAQLIRGSYTGANGGGGTRDYRPGTNIMATSYDSHIGYTVVMWPGSAQTADTTNNFNPDITTQHDAHVIFMGTTQAALGLASNCCETYASAFAPTGAYYIDNKLDDGLPGSGNLIAMVPAYFQTHGYTCTTTLVPSTAQYNVTNTKPACGLGVYNKF